MSNCECGYKFFYENDQALRHTIIDLRDSLPTLAVQILSFRHGERLAEIHQPDLLHELHGIISELHGHYEYFRTNHK